MTATTLALGSLAIALAAGVQWFRAVHRVAIPENRSGYLLVMLVSALTGIAAFMLGVGWVGGIAAGLAVTIACFFFLTVAISRQVAAQDAIAVGDKLPHFTATDENGEQFDSLALTGNPVLIKFFRGHW
ncbi:MAG: hypothetical protein AB8C02_01925 [Halioglobus sp.]